MIVGFDSFDTPPVAWLSSPLTHFSPSSLVVSNSSLSRLSREGREDADDVEEQDCPGLDKESFPLGGGAGSSGTLMEGAASPYP
jgi:hypothetical protein